MLGAQSVEGDEGRERPAEVRETAGDGLQQRTYVFLVVDYLPADLLTSKDLVARARARERRVLVLYSDKWRSRGEIDWSVVANHKFSLLQEDLS